MITARYHDSVNVLQEMFAAPACEIKPRAPFDRAEWYELLAQSGLTPLVATACDGDRRAALVLEEHAGAMTSFRNWYSFTWRPIAPTNPAGDALIEAIASKLRNRAHRVTLAPIPEEDGCATRLAKAFAHAGWRVEVSVCDTNHVVQVAGRSFEDYWRTRPGALRNTLRRKADKVHVTVHDRFDESVWKAYQDVYAASWKPREGGSEMLRAFAAQEGAAGRLRLGLADHEGQTVAAQFWTVEGGVAYIHKLAHLESHRHLSAGTILSAAMFRHAIDEDAVQEIDFGTGDEPYKRDWMEQTRPRFQIDCLDMTSLRAWIDLASLAASRLRDNATPALARLPAES